MKKISSGKSRNHIAIFLIAISLMLMMNSCARNGYGCGGRSKYITRVR